MRFNLEHCKLSTLHYYEAWLGKQHYLTINRGNQLIYTAERNKAQLGYSNHMDIYVWVEPDCVVVSYGDATKSRIHELKNLNGNVFEIAEFLHKLFNCRPTHAVKYFYQGETLTLDKEDAKAVTLTTNHYADFEKFWVSLFPSNNVDWLQVYFEDMVKADFCVGVYADKILVSCADAATMPYMAEQLQEVGINTLEKYRGKGYATIACLQAVENILRSGRYPIWSHSYANTVSRHIAEKIGFVKLADVLTLTL